MALSLNSCPGGLYRDCFRRWKASRNVPSGGSAQSRPGAVRHRHRLAFCAGIPMTGLLLATVGAAPLEWRLLCTTLAAVSTCLVLLPPRSKAARASFVMVGVGIMVATILPWLRHPAWAVAGLPIIVAAGPVAAWRRARPQPESLPVTFVTTRLALAFTGGVFFLWGVTGTGNAAVLTTIGAIAVMGACPIHRPASELLRHAGVDLRPLLVLLMGPLTWNVVAAREGLAWSASWLESLGLLSLWLGSLLLAAGGIWLD